MALLGSAPLVCPPRPCLDPITDEAPANECEEPIPPTLRSADVAVFLAAMKQEGDFRAKPARGLKVGLDGRLEHDMGEGRTTRHKQFRELGPGPTKCLAVIRQHVAEAGRVPTLAELAVLTGCTPTSVKAQLMALRERAFVTWTKGDMHTLTLVPELGWSDSSPS